jgi:HD-GYP domain-containing protein (c-di-GMP phosphodiesterase class II)
MLLIFYLPAMKNIQIMRQDDNTKMLSHTNTLPIINFILLTMLLGLEFMLDINHYLDYTYYAMILAFSILLYSSTQLSYNVLFLHIEETARIKQLSREAIDAEEEIVLAFAEITEAKSGQTGQHVKRVSEYTRVIAEAMGMDYKTVNLMRVASMMHDVGKLMIPPEILEKPGRLTDEEFEIMKNHVVIGESLLHNAPGEIMSMARVIAQQHHEWINGKGYLGMTGDEIELPAKICAVADVYDALTSARSYKKAWTAEEAYNIITEESGTHFDPEVVEAFKEHFEEIKEVQELYRDESSTYRF